MTGEKGRGSTHVSLVGQGGGEQGRGGDDEALAEHGGGAGGGGERCGGGPGKEAGERGERTHASASQSSRSKIWGAQRLPYSLLRPQLPPSSHENAWHGKGRA